MHTTPIWIPLANGLDLSKEAMLGQQELHTASNVDYAVDGSIKGRPSRSAPLQFVARDPASGTFGMLSPAAFAATGFVARGLMRLRDANGERAALGCDGRLFTQEGTRWTDRGPFACTRVDRVVNHANNLTGTVRNAVAQDFGPSRIVSNDQYYNLLTPTSAVDREVRTGVTVQVGGGARYGNSARCGTTTAAVVYSPIDHKLFLLTRSNGADALTTSQLVTDAATPTDDGDTPAICCSFDQTVFFVAYRTTTANVYKVLRVTTGGSVSATYTSGAITGLKGLWVDNTTVAGNKVVVAFTHTGGITTRHLNATTMADQSLDGTHDGSDAAGTVGLDVVVGIQSATLGWWAYRNSNAVADGDIVIGTVNLSTGAVARARKFWGGDTYSEAALRWSIAHQPMLVGNRMYLTLVAAAGRALTGTWVTIDLANWTSGGTGPGPFTEPMVVARGPTEATIPYFQPSSATLLMDGSGWTFATLDWSRFEKSASGSTVGLDASLGTNRVTLSKPRSAQMGESTVFSGSVPYTVSRGQSAELGFPFLAGVPGLSAEAASSGAVGIGNYTVAACWRWTDEAGQIHRGAPTALRTVAIPGGGAGTLRLVVSNPWLTSKSYGNLKIEAYSTDIDPTADADHFLQKVVSPNLAAAYTTIDITTQPITTSEALYTDGGEFLNVHVPGDGGVVAVGRRLWMADKSTVYASKLSLTGYAPAFSDEGGDGVVSLALPLPAGAGRVVALERLDDRVIIFCERGVYYIQDGGPDNTGLGPDFLGPMHLSDLSIAGPRSACSTDGGVLFCTALSVEAPNGGPWLIDRQLTITERQYLGRPAMDFFAQSGSVVPEVAYLPERQQAFVQVPGDKVVLIDMRVGKWGTWDLTPFGTFQSMTTVGKALWVLSTEVAPFDGDPGSDNGVDYAMVIKTAHMAANGQDGLGWGKVQGVSVLGAEGSRTHTLTPTVIQDGDRTTVLTGQVIAASSAATSWPSNRQAPEWRLPVPKCSTIQVQLSASPASARWAAIRLDVRPRHGRAPAKVRS